MVLDLVLDLVLGVWILVLDLVLGAWRLVLRSTSENPELNIYRF